MNKFMKVAIEEAENGINRGHGGPFGAVVVKNGEIIGRGHNHVVTDSDPTCHGEIDAIRNACRNIDSFSLEGADIYTTSEPCPMCLAAILWANINHVYYGCTIKENDMIGFRDEVFYNQMLISTKNLEKKLTQIDHDECLKLFEKYMKIKDKVNY